MNDLILHGRTREEAERFLQHPTHALLLAGPVGSGKQAVALWLAQQLLDLSGEQFKNYPYLLLVDAPTPSISIETIREQQQFMRLKTVGDKTIRRIAVMPDIDRMTTEAQNAFLKTLEEPPADTVLLMTVANPHDLMPTIRSRVQQLNIRVLPEETIKQHFADNHPQTAIDRAYLLSAGLPGLMTALLQQDETHPLTTAVTQAKTILQATSFERLAMVDALSKQKPEMQHVLQALKQIAQMGLQQASKQTDQARLTQWHKILKATHQAQVAVDSNANAKLLLTNLMLGL